MELSELEELQLEGMQLQLLKEDKLLGEQHCTWKRMHFMMLNELSQKHWIGSAARTPGFQVRLCNHDNLQWVFGQQRLWGYTWAYDMHRANTQVSLE